MRSLKREGIHQQQKQQLQQRQIQQRMQENNHLLGRLNRHFAGLPERRESLSILVQYLRTLLRER